ncbi:glycosyltransferase family 4 protein, partial [Mogibacterium timidum]|uniref:glycosyltransferase family 4 protein n=1 Tax=Mogibacterium timidum TaxID=35519 RepID=UPI00248B5C4F
MKKKVWIFNHYATDTMLDHGGRHYWFAKYLTRAGYDVRIFCASTVHDTDINFDVGKSGYCEKEVDGVKYTLIETSNYVGNGKSRVKNMYQYYRRIFRVVKNYGKPDVIFASSVHPLTLLAGIKIAKKLGVKCICEVRDLWPESLVEYDIISRNHIVTKLMYKGERRLYKKADYLIFTMPGAGKYISDRGWDADVSKDKIYYINNGIDLEVYKENMLNKTIEDKDLEDDSFKKVLYTGSLRAANKPENFISLAERLAEIAGNIKIIIYGGGDQLETLRAEVIEKGLKNILFKGRVDKEYIPFILSKGNLNLMDGDIGGISKYGISGNKLFDYIASGRPVIMDCEENEFGIINANKIGISRRFKDSSEMAEVIADMLNGDDNRYERWCENARKLALE